MSTLNYSNHARWQRMPQRGISEEEMERLLTYGDSIHQHDRTELYYFTKKSIRRMRRDGCSKKEILWTEKRANLTAVVAIDAHVIVTVYLRSTGKRVKRDLKRHNNRKDSGQSIARNLH